MGEKSLTWKTETEKESVWERIICLCLCKQPQFHHIIIICALFISISIFISLSLLSCIVIILVPAKYFHHTSFLHRYRFQFIYSFTREASQSLNAFVWEFFVAYIVAFHSEFLRILNEKRQHFLLVFNKFPLSICLPPKCNGNHWEWVCDLIVYRMNSFVWCNLVCGLPWQPVITRWINNFPFLKF